MMKKYLLTALAAAVVLTVGSLGAYYMMPSQYLALDINPSMELKVNRLNQVVSIKAKNEDAVKLLEGYRMDDKDLDSVLEDMVDLLDRQGYLTNTDKNDILLTVSAGSGLEAAVKAVNEKLADYLEACQIEGRVLDQSVELDRQVNKLAEENHVSAGRMALIERILKRDESVTAQELAAMRVSDLMAYAQEMGIDLHDLEDRLDHANNYYLNDRLEAIEDELDHMNDGSVKQEDSRSEDDRDEDDRYEDDRYEDDRYEDDRYEDDRYENAHYEDNRDEDDQNNDDRYDNDRDDDD